MHMISQLVGKRVTCCNWNRQLRTGVHSVKSDKAVSS